MADNNHELRECEWAFQELVRINDQQRRAWDDSARVMDQ